MRQTTAQPTQAKTHHQYPKVNPSIYKKASVSLGYASVHGGCSQGKVRESTSSNYVCAMASFAYLIGDIHYSQLNHAGILSTLANIPPNKMKGRVKAGAIELAVVILSEKAEMKSPTPSEMFAVRKLTR